MKIINHRRRKAISPVLATVILIAITLIAAIAVAGFVFGLFGTFTSSATLQVTGVVCHSGAAAAAYCVLTISNTGGSSGSITACSIYGQAGISGTTVPPITQATVTITAGTPSPGTTVYCESSATAIVAGSTVSGILTVASGSPLAFSAISH